MTPEQKIKSAILAVVARWEKKEPVAVSAENIDAVYEAADQDYVQDARNELRCTGTETGLPCQSSRHYESEAVAAKMPDDSWVGWTYWFGGGKYGEPESITWMDDAYVVDCVEEEKVVTVRTFTKPGAAS